MSFSTRNNVACVLGAVTNDPQLLFGLHAKGCGTLGRLGIEKNQSQREGHPSHLFRSSPEGHPNENGPAPRRRRTIFNRVRGYLLKAEGFDRIEHISLSRRIEAEENLDRIPRSTADKKLYIERRASIGSADAARLAGSAEASSASNIMIRTAVR